MKYLVYDKFGILNGKFFVSDFDPYLWGISDYQLKILKEGPENPEYHNIWEYIIENKTFNDENETYKLEQDKDYNLFIVKQ